MYRSVVLLPNDVDDGDGGGVDGVGSTSVEEDNLNNEGVMMMGDGTFRFRGGGQLRDGTLLSHDPVVN